MLLGAQSVDGSSQSLYHTHSPVVCKARTTRAYGYCPISWKRRSAVKYRATPVKTSVKNYLPLWHMPAEGQLLHPQPQEDLPFL